MPPPLVTEEIVVKGSRVTWTAVIEHASAILLFPIGDQPCLFTISVAKKNQSRVGGSWRDRAALLPELSTEVVIIFALSH